MREYKSIPTPLLPVSGWELKTRREYAWIALKRLLFMKMERHRLKEVGDLSKIPRQGTSVKGGGRLPGALSSIGALCPRAPRYCPAAPSNDPNLPKTARRGLRAPFTLHSWKCSDWSVSWISGSRFPGGCCCCCCCCEAEDEPAVRPSSTFLMLNFLMVSLPKKGSCLLEAPASGGTGWEGVRAAEARRRLRSRSAKERRAGDNPNRKGCDDGRAAAAAAASPLPPRPPRLQWRPTPPPHLVAAGLPPSRAAAAASMAPRPRSPSARPGLGLPLSAAARPAWPGYPVPVPDPACRSLPGRPAARCHLPEASVPGPPTPGRAGGEPRFQRRPRRWRQLGLRGAGCPVRMRAATPRPRPAA